MSGGERQRLLFAQALIGRPRLLLLDEPLISLDPRRQQRGRRPRAPALSREFGITVLFSAHELNQLLGAIDRVLYLGSGQAALGTVDDVITEPVLSRLYGAAIEVVRTGEHIFVLSESGPVEADAHQHDHAHDQARPRPWPFLTTISCAPRLRRAASSPSWPASSASSWSAAARPSPVTPSPTSASPARPRPGLIGIAPLWGMIVLTVAAGVGMGALGERLSGRDVAIGVVLALALGFGLLFLHYYTSYATQATALLFGNVLAVETTTLCLLVAPRRRQPGRRSAAISRPLLFATPPARTRRGARACPSALLGIAFLAIVALTVSASVQIVGVLLVFALMVGPAAAAERLTSTLAAALVAARPCWRSLEAWTGIVIAFYTDWPTSFCITALSALAYFAALALPRRTLAV